MEVALNLLWLWGDREALWDFTSSPHLLSTGTSEGREASSGPRESPPNPCWGSLAVCWSFLS